MASKELLQETDTRDLIIEHLKSDQRSLKWLAEQLGRNYNTMHSIFKQKTINLSQELLNEINAFRGTSFTL